MKIKHHNIIITVKFTFSYQTIIVELYFINGHSSMYGETGKGRKKKKGKENRKHKNGIIKVKEREEKMHWGVKRKRILSNNT